MYTSVKLLSRCMAAVMVLLAASCKHDNLLVPKPNENIRPASDFIRNNYDFRLFYAALEYTGLVNDLNGPGPFTILAPPDNAFNGVGIQSVEDIRKLNKDSLRDAMQYHVLKNRKLTTDKIPTNGVDVRYETLSGKSIYMSALTQSNAFFADGCKLLKRDIQLANGVLHVLNKMMQYHKDQSVQQYLAKQSRYSLFVSGLKRAGLWDELASGGPYTIYAPSNEAFASAGITQSDIDGLDAAKYDLTRLFGAYIVYGKHFFVTDQWIFNVVTGNSIYYSFLRNDDWKLQLVSITSRPDGPGGSIESITAYPELILYKPNPRVPEVPFIIGQVGQNYYKHQPLAGYDRLCENGLVHDLHGILIKPADALK